MEKKIRNYYYAMVAILILMGATLGGSIATFVIFLSYAPGQNIGPRLLHVNLISYVLLLSFIILFIIFVFLLIKVRTVKLENTIEGHSNNEK